MIPLSTDELAQIRSRDSATDPKWLKPSLELAPHYTAYMDRRKLLLHIQHLESRSSDDALRLKVGNQGG